MSISLILGTLKEFLPDTVNAASIHMIWYPFFVCTKNKQLFLILHFLLHLLPAYALDLLATLFGKKPMWVLYILWFEYDYTVFLFFFRLKKIYQKILKAADCLYYFSTQEWKFSNQNAMTLWNNLTAQDKELFRFVAHPSFSRREFIHNSMIGWREYLVQDPIDTLPRAKRKYFVLKFVHYSVMCLLLFLLFKMVLSLSSFSIWRYC